MISVAALRGTFGRSMWEGGVSTRVSEAAQRPFYGEYAWAYDLVMGPPDPARADFIARAFAARGAAAGARVLDAGCGAGGYAIELARRGYAVEGLDASAALVAEARARAAAEPARLPVTFRVGDILAPVAEASYDAILCRGVLNDVLDDAGRRAAFASFTRALRPGGVIVLDVREWEATARRKTRDPVFERDVETPRGRLTFRSVARLEESMRRLFVSERHTLRDGGAETVSTYEFTMRCWTREELRARLGEAGFESAEYFGAYDEATSVGTTDRIVCVASLRKAEGRRQ
jgi:SAM-dependent methyltransferase